MKETNLSICLILIVLLLSDYAFAQYNGAVIKGTITDSRDGLLLTGANVIILGTDIGVASDNSGYFIISGLSPGRYILKTSYIVYKSRIDTIVIKEPDEVVKLNIKLPSPIVDLEDVTTPRLETYHNRLQQRNKIEPVLKIHIDSLHESEYHLWAYLSVTNTSVDSFYLFRDYICFNVVAPLVTDSGGNSIKVIPAVTDCLGEKTCPDSTDLIYIGAGKTVKYPPTRLTFFNYGDKPKGRYSIKIKYEFKKPEEINTFYCRGESVIKALITGLRGTYISDNSVIFFNNR